MTPKSPKPPRPKSESALPAPKSLPACRRRIDEVDQTIVDLLDERARIAQRIGEIKRAAGREMFDAARHIDKLNRTASKGAGDFPAEGLRLVFAEIQSACLALEAKQAIGYLGPEGTFSNIAAMRVFGASVDYQPYASIPEIFQAVENDWVHYGIVPIENSTGGIVHTTLDELMESSLSICAEAHAPIHHHLFCSGKMNRIRKVCTHPQILMQCRNWLRANLPNVMQVEVSSSGEGAAMARADKSVAAIGPELAAKLNKLPILVRRIEDKKDNITRFLIIGRRSPAPSGNDKTSLMLSIRDEVGALMGLLEPFNKRGLNLTKIESRPSRKRAWDYIFFVDVEGHMSDPKLQAAFKEVKPHVTFLRVLGSYPIDTSIRK
jgi:chorismate mutase/prephenate dehydratase